MVKDYEYMRLYNSLLSRISSGEWAEGEQIPSISDLQEQNGIQSLGTVRRAQQLLVEDGLLETRQGSGTFVVSTQIRRRATARWGTIPIGVRLELWPTGERMDGAILREDIDAAAAPRPGDTFIPSSLGEAILYSLPGQFTVHHLEHFPILGRDRVKSSPLCLAVCRVEASYDDVNVDELRADGWSVQRMNP